MYDELNVLGSLMLPPSDKCPKGKVADSKAELVEGTLVAPTLQYVSFTTPETDRRSEEAPTMPVSLW